jgi:hypothetical protein
MVSLVRLVSQIPTSLASIWLLRTVLPMTPDSNVEGGGSGLGRPKTGSFCGRLPSATAAS